MDVELRLLRYFVAVAETLHFGRAAERLYISQPSLSQQVRRLEGDVGTALFHRDRRSVSLTEAGVRLLPRALAALEAGAQFARAAERESRLSRLDLVVGFHTRWPDHFLPRVLRTYRASRPDVTVQLSQYDFGDTSAGLRGGSSDAALVHLPLAPEGLRWLELSTDPRVIMVPEDLALARRRTTTVAEVLSTSLPWAIPPDTDPVWRDFWSAAPERAAAGGADVARVQPMTHEALFDVVAGGQAVVVTYASMERVYAPDGVSFVPVSDLAPAVLAVAWRADDTRPYVADFVRAVRAASARAQWPAREVTPTTAAEDEEV